MTTRITCCVPFCKRSYHNREEYTAWICAPHWRAVSVLKRRRCSKMRRQYLRRFGANPPWAYKGGSPDRLAAAKLYRLRNKAWDSCMRQAIERAMGI
jgi:hypothetical protein